MRDIARWWRRIRGRCILCTKPLERHKDCVHCAFNPLICHNCGKHYSFGKHYGMGKEKLLKVLEK